MKKIIKLSMIAAIALLMPRSMARREPVPNKDTAPRVRDDGLTADQEHMAKNKN